MICRAHKVTGFICYTLRDLVPFIQFKKREKQEWRGITFSKSNTPHGCFPRFLNCTDGNKWRKASHMCNCIFCLI